MSKKQIIAGIIAMFLLGLGVSWLYNSLFTLDTDPRKVEETQEEKENKEKSEIAKQLGEYTVLLLGVDTPKGFKTRTDTIILATVDAETRKARMVSIPRDTRVQLKGSWDKINAAYVYGGLELCRETVEDFLGVKIDRYAIVNFNSLVHLVDAVGGLEVDVPIRMYYPDEKINLHPGLQILDGADALAYSRFRYTKEGDIGRAKRQQEIIRLLIDKIISVEGMKKLPELIELMQANVETDIPVKEIIALAKLAPDILDNDILSLVVPGRNAKIDGLWYWEPDLEELATQLQSSTEIIHAVACMEAK